MDGYCTRSHDRPATKMDRQASAIDGFSQDPQFVREGWWRRRESNPLYPNEIHRTEPAHNQHRTSTNPCSYGHLRQDPYPPEDRNRTLPEQDQDSSLHSECVTCVSKILECYRELLDVIAAWPQIPKSTRSRALDLIRQHASQYKADSSSGRRQL